MYMYLHKLGVVSIDGHPTDSFAGISCVLFKFQHTTFMSWFLST